MPKKTLELTCEILSCEWNENKQCMSRCVEIKRNYDGIPVCAEYSDDSLSIHNMRYWLLRDEQIGHPGLSDAIRYQYTLPTFYRCWKEAMNRAEAKYSKLLAGRSPSEAGIPFPYLAGIE